MNEDIVQTNQKIDQYYNELRFKHEPEIDTLNKNVDSCINEIKNLYSDINESKGVIDQNKQINYETNLHLNLELKSINDHFNNLKNN